jgi:hypothetical protein
LEKKQHPEWNDSYATEMAKKHFNEAALNWFVKTVELCAKLRPKAKWGYYGLPMNFVYPCTGTGSSMQCGYDDPSRRDLYRSYSDQLAPLWKASGALFPSIYIYEKFSHDLIMAYIRSTGRLKSSF